MRAWLIGLALVAGCGSKKEAAKETAGSGSAAGSGSGSAAATATVDAAPAAAACDLNGTYRLRFASNGAEGWWLLLDVTGGKDAKVTGGKTSMLGLDEKGAPADIKLDDKACTISIARKTEQAGDLKIALAVDGNKVTGTVSRTDQYGKGTTPIAGVRETSPEKAPDCIKPGKFKISTSGVKKWLDENGQPGSKECKTFVPADERFIRVSMLEGEVVIDEIGTESEKDSDQSFGRGKVTKTAECEYDLEYLVSEYELKKGHIKFAGDSFSGKTAEFKYEIVMEGDEGENMMSCNAKDVALAGKRVGD